MNGDRLDLCDLARTVLTEMSERDRVALMAEMAAALSGPRALDLLSQLRATASLRMQEIIDERYPLHELAEACGDAQAVHVRLVGADRGGVSQGNPGGSRSQKSVPCQTSGSRPWEALTCPEAAQAYLEQAPAAEIEQMVQCLLEGRPCPTEWQVAQAHISSVLRSNAALLRRVISARGKMRQPKFRFQIREFEPGMRS